jgi:hypothetical protein
MSKKASIRPNSLSAVKSARTSPVIGTVGELDVFGERGADMVMSEIATVFP